MYYFFSERATGIRVRIFHVSLPFLSEYSRSPRFPAVTMSGTSCYLLWLAHAAVMPLLLLMSGIMFLIIFQPVVAIAKESDFPIGVFAVTKSQIPLAASLGFEVVHEYRFEESPNKDDEVAAYLEKALQYNLRVMMGFDRGEHFNEKRVAERVVRFRNHKALWGWYITDEPKEGMEETVRSVASLIKRLDPNHPTLIASDNPVYLKMADLTFSYEYPVWNKPYPEQNLKIYVDRTRTSVNLGTQFLSLVQAFNWEHYRQKDPKKGSYRLPTATEIRFMAYSGLAMGSRGLFFFSFQTLPYDRKYLDDAIVPVVKEFKRIRLFMGWEKAGLPDFVEPDIDLIYRCWRKGKDVTMVVTNPTPKKRTCSIKVDFNKNFLEAISHRGPDVVEPWGVAIYKFVGGVK